GKAGLVVGNVKIETNPKTRESRLFSSIPEYLRRNGPVILRAYGVYWPVLTFGYMAIALLLLGLVLGGRCLCFYVRDPDVWGHVPSLQVGGGAVGLGFVVGLMALLGDLLAANRRLNEGRRARMRRIDADLAANRRARGVPLDGIRSTGAPSWRPTKQEEPK